MANCSACGHSKEQHRPVCFANECNCEYFEWEGFEVPNDLANEAHEKLMTELRDKYCDSCLTAAYDEIGNGLEEQILVLDTMADLLPDHLCDHGEEPDIPCECRAHRFNRVH